MDLRHKQLPWSEQIWAKINADLTQALTQARRVRAPFEVYHVPESQQSVMADRRDPREPDEFAFVETDTLPVVELAVNFNLAQSQVYNEGDNFYALDRIIGAAYDLGRAEDELIVHGNRNLATQSARNVNLTRVRSTGDDPGRVWEAICYADGRGHARPQDLAEIKDTTQESLTALQDFLDELENAANKPTLANLQRLCTRIAAVERNADALAAAMIGAAPDAPGEALATAANRAASDAAGKLADDDFNAFGIRYDHPVTVQWNGHNDAGIKFGLTGFEVYNAVIEARQRLRELSRYEPFALLISNDIEGDLQSTVYGTNSLNTPIERLRPLVTAGVFATPALPKRQMYVVSAARSWFDIAQAMEPQVQFMSVNADDGSYNLRLVERFAFRMKDGFGRCKVVMRNELPRTP